jgi:hypothetical protein
VTQADALSPVEITVMERIGQTYHVFWFPPTTSHADAHFRYARDRCAAVRPSSAPRYAVRKKTRSSQESCIRRINEAGRRTFGRRNDRNAHTSSSCRRADCRRKLRERCVTGRGTGTGLTAVLIRDGCRPAKDAMHATTGSDRCRADARRRNAWRTI